MKTAKKKAKKKSKKRLTKKARRSLRGSSILWGNKRVHTEKIEGEDYLNFKDVIDVFADMLVRDRSFNNYFIMENIERVANIRDIRFWNDESFKNLHEVIFKSLDKFNDYYKSDVVWVICLSDLDTSKKLEVLRKSYLDGFNSRLLKNLVEGDKIAKEIKTYLLGKYTIDQDELIKYSESNSELMGAIVSKLKIEEIDDQGLLEAVARSSNHESKAIEAVKKLCCVDLLKDIIVNDAANMNIIRACRERIKTMPNTVKFLAEIA